MKASKSGMFIGELRREKNWTQAELAEKLGVTDNCLLYTSGKDNAGAESSHHFTGNEFCGKIRNHDDIFCGRIRESGHAVNRKKTISPGRLPSHKSCASGRRKSAGPWRSVFSCLLYTSKKRINKDIMKQKHMTAAKAEKAAFSSQ